MRGQLRWKDLENLWTSQRLLLFIIPLWWSVEDSGRYEWVGALIILGDWLTNFNYLNENLSGAVVVQGINNNFLSLKVDYYV